MLVARDSQSKVTGGGSLLPHGFFNSARARLEANDDNSVGERSSQCAEDRHSNDEQHLSHDVMDEPLCGRPYPRHGAV